MPASGFNVTVRRWLFVIVALVLVIAVAYICISPAVDLDPTITRAWQRAALLLYALACMAQVIVAAVYAPRMFLSGEDVSFLPRGILPPEPPNSVLNCSRLC